jgi:hypothetical protein
MACLMHVTPISHHSGLILGNSVGGYQKPECGVPIVCQSCAMADHNCLTTEQRAKVVVFFFAKKKKCYCHPEKIFGCVSHSLGTCMKYCSSIAPQAEEEGSVEEEQQPWAPAEHFPENV